MRSPSESTLDKEEPGSARTPAVPREGHLFRVLDCERPLSGSARHRLAGLDLVAFGRGPRPAASRSDGSVPRLALELADHWMSSRHALLSREGARWVLEDTGSKNGTTLNGLRVAGRVPLTHGDVLELGHTFFLYREVEPAPEQPSDLEADAASPGPAGWTTLSARLARDLSALERIARAPVWPWPGPPRWLRRSRRWPSPA